MTRGSIVKVFMVLLFTSLFALAGIQNGHAELPATDYEKWGKIAVDVARLNYTDSEISDYEYKGRKALSVTQVKDTFDLKVKRENRSFTARVEVVHNPRTNSLISVSIQELNR